MFPRWHEYPKSTRRTLRKLAARVVHAELEQALAGLEKDFRAWREGGLAAESLQERIHAFDRGPGRQWWMDAGESQPIGILVRGLRGRQIGLDEIPEAARDHLAAGLKLA